MNNGLILAALNITFVFMLFANCKLLVKVSKLNLDCGRLLKNTRTMYNEIDLMLKEIQRIGEEGEEWKK